MHCMQIHDFINGTTVTLSHWNNESVQDTAPFDILHPGRDAAELVRSQMKALESLPSHPSRDAKPAPAEPPPIY